MVADAANGPLPLDKHIQKQQWDHLRQLGHEWAQTAGAGREFKLCIPQKVRDENGTRFISLFTRSIFKDANSSIPAGLRQDIGDLLSRLAIQSESGHPLDDGGNNIGDISNETILVWIGATESGNSTARENLQRLQQQFVANASNQACGLHFLLPLAFLTMFFFLQLWIN